MHTLRFLFLLIPILLFTQCSREDEIIQNTQISQFQDQEGVSFLIVVKDEQGNPLNNVRLTDNLSGATYTSDEQGLIALEDLTVPVGGLPVSLEKAGWMKAIKRLKGFEDSRKTVEIRMTQFDMESQIPAGGSGNISGGGQLSLPATLLTTDNNAYTGPVTVKSFYYDPARADFLQTAPGDMSAVGSGGENYTLESYGMYAIELFDDAGNELEIPTGESAQLRFPIAGFQKAGAPAEIPLWSLDESSGKWVEEGAAIRTGDIYIAEVAHFSWWNCDVPFTPVDVCMQLVDLNGNPVSNFTYLVSSPDLQTQFTFGTTDQNGDLCASFPEGMPVVIRILVNGELTASTSLGAFSEPADIGEVTLEINLNHVQGKALACDGTPIANAVVRTALNGSTDYTLTNDAGNFQLSFMETGQLIGKIFNYTELQESQEFTLQLNPNQTTYNVGEIAVCDELDSNIIPVAGNISADVTWLSGKTYILTGRIVVEPGVTLTIEPGVVVKGQPGVGVEASMLWVAQGAKLMAEGTAASPIIFTSSLDEIEPGMLVSPNLTSSDIGMWGGVQILGEAPVSVEFPDPTIQGIPASDPYNKYGGNNPNDNSGVLRYVSIRHGGVNIGEGNEINALTLAGVGSGTTIEHIELAATLDDGIEWFGGTVNVKHALVWNADDDAIDTDQAWAGTLDNFIVIAAGSRPLELDGPEGAYEAGHIIQNGSVIASDTLAGRISDDLINVDENSMVALKNIYITGIVEGQQVNRTDAPGVSFENIFLDVPPADLGDFINGTPPAGITAGGTPQADKSVFNWTWAELAGKLNGI